MIDRRGRCDLPRNDPARPNVMYLQVVLRIIEAERVRRVGHGLQPPAQTRSCTAWASDNNRVVRMHVPSSRHASTHIMAMQIMQTMIMACFETSCSTTPT